jgi:pimeloyl-ACP methyl ester carboxylesterase
MIMTERVLQCSDGTTLAGLLYQSRENNKNNNSSTTTTSTTTTAERILCLHGWMDNCESFYHLAPAIVRGIGTGTGTPALHDVELFAMDFPGHGLSSHRPVEAPPTLLSELTYSVAEAVQQLGWVPSLNNAETTTSREDHKGTSNSNKPFFTIVGHSMGAAVGCLYAAAFPDHVQRLVLVEGAGPLSRPARDVSKHIRQHILKRWQGGRNGTKPPRIYESLEQAIQTRCQTARYSPGNQWLTAEGARRMVIRATTQVVDPTSSSSSNHTAVRFRHDPRLQWPSLQYMTPEQVDAVYEDIQCPTALILAQDGWPFSPERMQASLDRLRPVLYKTLPGSHHFHADPETAESVAKKVVSFLKV